MKPTSFTEKGPGFYSLQSQLVDPDQPWSISTDWVVALHVRADAGQGQALATCHCDCGDGGGGIERRERRRR